MFSKLKMAENLKLCMVLYKSKSLSTSQRLKKFKKSKNAKTDKRTLETIKQLFHYATIIKLAQMKMPFCKF